MQFPTRYTAYHQDLVDLRRPPEPHGLGVRTQVDAAVETSSGMSPSVTWVRVPEARQRIVRVTIDLLCDDDFAEVTIAMIA